MTPTEEQRQKERQGEVAELVAKMNDCGAPPKEIMGELPPGEFDPHTDLFVIRAGPRHVDLRVWADCLSVYSAVAPA